MNQRNGSHGACSWIGAVTAIVGFFTFTACGGNAASSGPTGSGGAGTSGAGTGGATAAGSGTGGTGTATETGSGTGTGTVSCPPDITTTVEEYCIGEIAELLCTLTPNRYCSQRFFGSTWEKGCGYVRETYYGDQGDGGMEVWTEATGKLVYETVWPGWAPGCPLNTNIGTPPVCDSWTKVCVGGDESP